MAGTYLYAIIAGEHKHDLGPMGLPDGTAQVVTVPEHGLTAVVSEYQGPSFRDLPKAEFLRGLIIHQQVIERVMADYAILPVKYGTVLAAPAAVRAALAHFRVRLAGALEELGDAVEIDLIVTWDPGTIFAEIGREPAIATLAAAVAGRAPQETLAARIQVGQLVQEALERRRQEYRRQIVDALVPVARDAQPNPLPADELVLNVAFLVERNGLSDFDAIVQRLGEELGSRLSFRYVGPLPPYSFAMAEFTQPDPDQIAAARQLLQLDEQVTAAELQARYRQLAALVHPDRHPEDPAAPARFAALTAAHDRLEAFMRGQRADEGPLDQHR
jgi:hypothetical protein